MTYVGPSLGSSAFYWSANLPYGNSFVTIGGRNRHGNLANVYEYSPSAWKNLAGSALSATSATHAAALVKDLGACSNEKGIQATCSS